MRNGTLDNSRNDIAISITGYAGDAIPGQEAGLVFFALTTAEILTEIREKHFDALSRGEIRIASLRSALDMVY